MRLLHSLLKLEEPMPAPSVDPRSGETVIRVKTKFGTAELRFTPDEIRELATADSAPVG